MTKEHPAVKIRSEIIQEKGWKLVKVFDTNQHEPDKDVVLIEDEGIQKVFRVGECQPLNFYPEGYVGEYIVIPKVFEVDTDIPYEVEEYLPGTLLCEVMPKPTAAELVSSEWLERLIKGHWEFQEIALPLDLLKRTWSVDTHLKKYLEVAKPILDKLYADTEKIVLGGEYDFFWEDTFPCKWKYSDDNLIAMPDNKLGLIDNVKVSKRHWGYDLGWIIWPRWFQMDTSEYKNIDAQWNFLVSMGDLVWELAPEKEKNRGKREFLLRWWLVVFERLIGTMYDVVAKISHAQEFVNKDKREELFVAFIKELLKKNMNEIKKYSK